VTDSGDEFAPGSLADQASKVEGRPRSASPVPKSARPYQGERAGVVTRTAAGVIDYALVTVSVFLSYSTIALLLFVSNPISYSWPRWQFYWFLIAGWSYLVIYLAVAWRVTGRTYGDRIMGIRVVNYQGRRMRTFGSLARATFCAFLPVGLFWCVFSGSNRSIQDIVLRTSVIHDWQHRHPTA
jgi:uncharacterized RDD family membrane protein YckC